MKAHWRLGLAGLSVIAVAYGFARYGYGLFLPEIRREFGLSVEALGFIASGSYVGYLAALSTVGLLAARVGPRPLVVTGALCAGTGMAVVALAPNAAILAAGVVLAGTASGWAWAPYSDAVARTVPPSYQGRVLSVISTGTTFGVIVAGPVALLAGASWRGAWIAFAVAALVAAVWNARVLPSGPYEADAGASLRRLGFRWFVGAKSVPLFASAFSYGLVGAVYWSFALDLIAQAGYASPAVGPLFWTLIGIAGVTGVFTGELIDRFGLRLVFVALLACLGVAIGMLGAAPASLPVLIASAVLYGASFMPMAALLAVWSSDVFAERPSTGFSATVFLLGLGTILGPAALGAFAGRFGLDTAFVLTAALALLTTLAGPRSGVRRAAPRPREASAASRADTPDGSSTRRDA